MDNQNQSKQEKINLSKGDFVEIKYTGTVEGRIFDSNILEDAKKINEKANPEKTIVIIGQNMLVKGLDKELEGKELNKSYEITLEPKDAFGFRRTDLVRIIPLKVFHEQRLIPRQGASFVFDNQLAKVIAVSGARVITDFNNPLAGKEVTYKFSVSRIVNDLKEKAETVCKLLFGYIPKIDVENESIIINGPKILENFLTQLQPKFKEFLGKEVSFKETVQEKSQKQ